jgi:hypothetical protein
VPRFSLDFGGVQGAAQRSMIVKMNRAVLVVQRAVKEKINVGGTAAFPSMEGEPPHKVSTRLFQSIVTKVYTAGSLVIGLVGSKVIYARRLELGFVGTDRAGRNVQQGPRPYLRPAFRESSEAVKRELGGTPISGGV